MQCAAAALVHARLHGITLQLTLKTCSQRTDLDIQLMHEISIVGSADGFSYLKDDCRNVLESSRERTAGHSTNTGCLIAQTRAFGACHGLTFGSRGLLDLPVARYPPCSSFTTHHFEENDVNILSELIASSNRLFRRVSAKPFDPKDSLARCNHNGRNGRGLRAESAAIAGHARALRQFEHCREPLQGHLPPTSSSLAEIGIGRLE